MSLLVSDPALYLKRELDRKSRVLLINPPVEERRYHWLRWNQPTELLRLSTWLKRTHRGLDVKLFDFMFPDENERVPKHKVKETWKGNETDDQLWHFGQPLAKFEDALRSFIASKWVPDLIVVSSLTSYWHASIEKLLPRICELLGKKRRQSVTIGLYGNYPRLEPEHAQEQTDADVAFCKSVVADGLPPDFDLYKQEHGRLPHFFGLDVNDRAVGEHLEQCLSLRVDAQRRLGVTRPASITVAFFNEDLCSHNSNLEQVVSFAARRGKQFVAEGITGIEPRSLTRGRLEQLKAANFRSLFVEHARLPGGAVDEQAYDSLLSFLANEAHHKKSGAAASSWIERGNVTGFVGMGRQDDDIDALVEATVKINSFFQAVILKPFGYSPTIDRAEAPERRKRWPSPCASSPQWFPYVGNGSSLCRGDYDNLLRWQNVLNKRVKGATFDFLDDGNVARMVRETLVGESWKRQPEVR